MKRFVFLMLLAAPLGCATLKVDFPDGSEKSPLHVCKRDGQSMTCVDYNTFTDYVNAQIEEEQAKKYKDSQILWRPDATRSQR